MGLLDTLAQGLLDDDVKKLGIKLSAPQIAGFVQAAVGIVQRIGLPKLIELFKKAGLEKQVLSWIGKGKNQAVTGTQVQTALGPKLVGELAKKVGLDAPSASSVLAAYLPKVVDILTPDGEADDEKAKERSSGFDLGDVGNLLGSILGK
jgi:uncharacterized protein YidB (DUF937 family)